MTGATWQDLLNIAGEGGFTPIAPGEYDMYVVSATAKQSSSGKDMIALRLKVESGPHEGREVFSNIVISPESTAAVGFLFRKLRAFGLDDEYFGKLPGSITASLPQVAEDLENRRCIADVTVREWQGQERNDINTVKPPADGVTHHVTESIPDFGGLDMFTSPPVTTAGSAYSPPEMPF